jgi:hypothetical protein
MTASSEVPRPSPGRSLFRCGGRVITATACAAALLAALPAAPALAAGTTTDVLVFGGTALQVLSVSIDTSSPGATVTLFDSASTVLFEDFQAVERGDIAAAQKDANIYVSSDGQGTDTFLSSAFVSSFTVSEQNNPPVATVRLAAQSVTTACTGSDDSCAPAGLPAVRLSSSANPSTAGSSVIFTATEPALQGAGPPDGTSPSPPTTRRCRGART